MATKVNQLEVAAGSASAPSIKFLGGKTGWYRKAGGILFSYLGTRMGGLNKGTPFLNTGAVVAFGGTNQTLTVAHLLNGKINGTPTGAAAYTTPTAAEIDAAFPDVATGDSFEVTIVNTSGGANAITVTGGTGVTVKGTAAIAQNRCAKCLFLRTGAAAWDVWVPAG